MVTFDLQAFPFIQFDKLANAVTCSSVGQSFINVNEVTTVATVWALSPFMTGIANVGSSQTNSLGISNAFAAINKVANTANGAVSGPALPSNATLPVAEIDTLADMLEVCVNSGGGSASDTTDGQTNGTACGIAFLSRRWDQYDRHDHGSDADRAEPSA